MEALQGNTSTAEIGFKWVLDKIQKHLTAADTAADLADLRELSGLTKDCYAQLLLQRGRFAEARRLFADALSVYVEIHGREQPDVVALLNNLAVVCTSVSLGLVEQITIIFIIYNSVLCLVWFTNTTTI